MMCSNPIKFIKSLGFKSLSNIIHVICACFGLVQIFEMEGYAFHLDLDNLIYNLDIAMTSR